VAERLVVPMKPVNSGGGKEPWFWVFLKKKEDEDDWRQA